jgi:hypothetical protein
MMVSGTDKETRLKEFVGEAFSARGEGPAQKLCVTLFVRNADSPAARALYAAWSEGLIDGAQILVALGEANVEDPAAPSVFDIRGAHFRVISDARFGAAHEQMTIGHSRVWLGDCLRRDPAKRDAFELYHGNDTTSCVFAIASFEKIWSRAKPQNVQGAESLSPEIIAARADEANALVPDPRH